MDYGNITRIDSETASEGTEDGPPKILDSSDTTSSSSSDDLFQVNHRTLLNSSAPKNIPKLIKGTKPLHKNDHIDISNEALFKLEECIESPESTSRFSDITHESFLLPNFSPTQSPPIQVMERGFDPNRIPAFVFSGPSTPMDWSVASNESLFSIRIGNNSFNKDQGLRTCVEVQKSGELRKSTEVVSEELFRSGKIDKSRELNKSEEVFKSGEVKRSDELVKSKQSDKGVLVDNVNEPVIGVTQAHNNKKLHVNFVEPRDIAIAKQPEKSEHVIQISAFPKKKKSSCPMCHCSDCFHALYCCKRPSCSCKWFGCCFKWPSCSSKCFNWPSCSGSCLSCKGCRCKFPSCCCKCPSFRFKCPSWPSCNFKCQNWSNWCCKCPSWPSCKCHSSSCTWTCCSCWKSKPKKSRYVFSPSWFSKVTSNSLKRVYP